MENIYLKTKEKASCNGCTACALVCPKHCIEMKEDKEGFIYPVVDESRCIHCGRCLKTCSNYQKQEVGNYLKAYAIINKDKQILMKSTSGGVFHALLKYIFKNENAVCYGAAYDDELIVKHMRATNIDEAMKFMGSKYVRSDIIGIYEQVRADLKNEKMVLFTATPCETMGLYTYLGKDYKNLITCDIICHSNPSPKVFRKYINALQVNYDKKAVSYTFRSKSNGWSNPMPILKLEDGTTLEEGSFQRAFSRVLISRPCCSECKFTKPYKVADITIGDFWGVDKLTNISNYEQGISLCLANNSKGVKIIEDLENIQRVNLSDDIDYFKYNHNKPEKAHRNRDRFFARMQNCKDQDFIKLLNKMSNERLIRRAVNMVKKIRR